MIEIDKIIKQKGYRISPRWSLEDKMARFVQLYFEEKGKVIEFIDAQCLCNLILLKNDGDIMSILSRIDKGIMYHPMVTRSRATLH